MHGRNGIWSQVGNRESRIQIKTDVGNEVPKRKSSKGNLKLTNRNSMAGLLLFSSRLSCASFITFSWYWEAGRDCQLNWQLGSRLVSRQPRGGLLTYFICGGEIWSQNESKDKSSCNYIKERKVDIDPEISVYCGVPLHKQAVLDLSF